MRIVIFFEFGIICAAVVLSMKVLWVGRRANVLNGANIRTLFVFA